MGSLALLIALVSAEAPAIAAFQDSAGVRARAFDLAYNLDHDEAVAILKKAVQQSPNDPALHRALASVLWLNMLFRRGAITVDHYLGSFSRTQVELKQPPPDLDAAFRLHVGRAIALAETRVAASPRDPQAHFDLGTAVGLHASYVATVEGRMMAGFKGARRAFNEHEKVLELDANRKDAGLVIGTYRYIVSTLSLPMRMMAYVAGFGGGRDLGISMLQETAAQRGESQTDALFALVLVYNRERQFDAALKALDALRRMYPRNRLVVLEAGSTALRGQRYAQADALLTEGLGILAREKRERIPGEEMLWRYKRGAARVGLGQAEAALADLRAATLPGAPSWVSGRAHIELARLSLAGGDRQSAANQAARAESLCAAGNDPACIEQARSLLTQSRGGHGR